MRIIESSDRMTVRQIPIVKWILGVIFASGFLALTLFFLSAVWSNPRNFLGGPETGWFDRIMSWITFAILFAFVAIVNICLATLINSPVMKTVIDRRAKTVTVSRRRIFGGQAHRFLFLQVRDFVIETVSGERKTYFVALRLVNDELVRIDDDSQKDSQKTVDRLNEYLQSAQNA